MDAITVSSPLLIAEIPHPGVGALSISADRRWSAWKLIVQTYFVATTLPLLGAIRAWDDVDTGRLLTWLYLEGWQPATSGSRCCIAR